MAILICGLPYTAANSSAGGLTATAQPRNEGVSPVDGISMAEPNWRREGGFLVAEIVFNNMNRFPVGGVIITCSFLGPDGSQLESRGSLILQSLPPGLTQIGGIEFTTLKGNMLDPGMLGGACAVASTDR